MKKTGGCPGSSRTVLAHGGFQTSAAVWGHYHSISRHVHAQAAGADPVIVVTGYRAEELEAHLKGAGACFVRNTRYRHTQMFDSVKLGIQAALEGCERILVMPMDLPAITDDIIKQVMEAPGRLCGRSMTANRGIPYAWKGDCQTHLHLCRDQDLRGPLKPQACR